jgi:hypothetical protein
VIDAESEVEERREYGRKDNMRTLLVVFILLLVGIVGLAFYRGWFSLTTANADHKPSATITVDKDKIKEDERLAKDKVRNLNYGAKQETVGPAGKTAETQPRP